MKKVSSFWQTYIFLALSSIGLAVAMLYFVWLNIISNATNELIYANKTMASSTSSILQKHRSLLSVLGGQLIDLGGLETSTPAAQHLITKVLSNNPDLAGFGLARPSGELTVTSFKLDPNKNFNLLKRPETTASFHKALQSEQMILGRTYYMPIVKQWLIPLRLRITGPNGDIIAVMTSGLKMWADQSLWSSYQLPDYMRFFVVRNDFYRQYVPETIFGSFESTYSTPTPEPWLTAFKKNLLDQTGADLATIRNNPSQVYTVRGPHGKQRDSAITSISYNPTFHHYTFTVTPIKSLVPRLYLSIYWLAAFSLIFNIILYGLFRSNSRLQAEARHNLKFQATHDQLTNLPNRRYLLNEFTQWAAKCNNHFHVIYIDLDNFKNCNDLHGHSIGDQVLQEVAARIKHGFAGCLQIRQGGDEFIILSPGNGNQHALNLCNHFLKELLKPIFINGLDFSIKASIGISHAPEHGSNIDDLLRKADMAMYEAKTIGSTVFIYSDHLEDQQKESVAIEKELTCALHKDELFLVYQPQVDAQTNQLIGVEALLRWDSEALGFIPPDIFIPIAESSGLIISIGDFVLETSMREISQLVDSNEQLITARLSVNISIHQLLELGFINKVAALIQKYPRLQLVIEVTESIFIDDLNSAKLILEKVQSIGVEVSLDDFGTGYSSLSVLSKLPINELKIDKSFIQHALSNSSDKNLIQSIISLGKALNIPVLSEGVESQEQAELLLSFGCDLFQGYYFSRPLKKEFLSAYLAQLPQAPEPALAD